MKTMNYVIILTLGLATLPALAQQHGKGKMKELDLNPVVVTGTGTHHRLSDSPVPVEVISGNDLRKAGITNFQDAITMLSPSFSFSSTAMADYTTISGLGNERLLVMVNGHKLSGNTSGATDISRIDVSRIRRVEILKGASSSLYGSDAIGGVINIITDQPMNTVNASSTTRIAEYRQFDQNLNLNVASDKFGSYTSYNRRQANGWQLNPEAVSFKNGEVSGDPKPTRKNMSNPFFQNVFNQRFSYSPTKAWDFYVEGSYYNKKNDRPANIYTEKEGKNGPTYTSDGQGYDYNLKYMGYTLGAGARYMLNKSDYISLDLYNDNYETNNEYIVTNKTYTKGEEKLNQRSHYYNANLKGVFTLNAYNRLTAGAEYLNESLRNPDAFEKTDSEKKHVYTMSLYAQDEIKLPWDFRAVLGLRYVHHETFANDLSPKATLMKKLGPVNLRASYSTGFRAPTLKELYYYKPKNSTMSMGNPDLDPEKSYYYSLNAEYIHRFFSVSVTGYINNVKDLIELADIDDASNLPNYDPDYTYKLYSNVEKAKVKGVDVSVNCKPGYGLSFLVAYNYVSAKDEITKLTLQRAIRHSGNFSANWFKGFNNSDLNLNLSAQIRSSRYEDSQPAAPGYAQWNFTARYTLRFPKYFSSLEPSVGVENIFDKTDKRYFGYYFSTLSPGRVYWASIALRFDK